MSTLKQHFEGEGKKKGRGRRGRVEGAGGSLGFLNNVFQQIDQAHHCVLCTKKYFDFDVCE